MAIKISGTTIIDDGRNLVNVNNISIGGAVGAANSVLTSNGSQLEWANPASMGGGALSIASYFSSNS